MTNEQAVLAAHNACIQKAQELYGLDLSKVEVLFTLRSLRRTGNAQSFTRNGETVYRVFYHPVAMNANCHSYVNTTVPHELAHIVCFMDPSLGNNESHDAGWKSVCLALGGDGLAHVACPVISNALRRRAFEKHKARGLGKLFLYRLPSGLEIHMTPMRHKRILHGTNYRARETSELITKEHFVNVVHK